jgi:hypothetical protein
LSIELFYFSTARLSLTTEKDIFPALSGLTKQMNREMNDSYLEGLWKNNSLLDVLWKVNIPRNEWPIQWRAPSWSWAHRQFPVNWADDLRNECEQELHLKIPEASQVAVGENEMSETSLASLVLSAGLCPAILVIYTPKSNPRDPVADLEINREFINYLPGLSATLYSLPMETRLDAFLPSTTKFKG